MQPSPHQCTHTHIHACSVNSVRPSSHPRLRTRPGALGSSRPVLIRRLCITPLYCMRDVRPLHVQPALHACARHAMFCSPQLLCTDININSLERLMMGARVQITYTHVMLLFVYSSRLVTWPPTLPPPSIPWGLGHVLWSNFLPLPPSPHPIHPPTPQPSTSDRRTERAVPDLIPRAPPSLIPGPETVVLSRRQGWQINRNPDW